MKKINLFFTALALLCASVGMQAAEEVSTCPAGTLVDGKVTHNLTSCTIVQEQGTATSAPKSVSPWKAPANSLMTITPNEGVTLQQLVVNIGNTTYATWFNSATLTNATMTKSNNIFTITPTDGTKPVVINFVKESQFKELTITYTQEGGSTDPDPEPVTTFTVTVTAENGTVAGLADGGLYEVGTEATLTATPAEGYEFVNWTVGGNEVSTANPYTFKVEADLALVANFKATAVEPEPEPEPQPTTETVYFINNRSWDKVNAYAWTTTPIVTWPGAAATKETEQISGYDVYSYTLEAGAAANVIFNNGSGNQTNDLKWTAGKYYWMGNAKNFAGATKEEAEVALAKPIEYEYVYFVNNQSWGKVNIYTWSPEVGTWPGTAMTKEVEQLAGYDVYSYKVEKGTSFGGMLFTNGSGVQTEDTKYTAGKYYWMGVEKDFAGATKEEAIEKLSAPVTPPVITYVLMGVQGDWNTGIALTVNPDNENEYVLLGQEIAVGDSVKVVTLSDGKATAWCGNVDEASPVEFTHAEGNGNIVLVPGKYDFYFKLNDLANPEDDCIYIGFSQSGPSTALDNIQTEEAPVKFFRNGQLIILKNGVEYNAQGAKL